MGLGSAPSITPKISTERKRVVFSLAWTNVSFSEQLKNGEEKRKPHGKLDKDLFPVLRLMLCDQSELLGYLGFYLGISTVFG